MSEGKPKPGGSVDAMRITETHELYVYRDAAADQDGKFVITNLPPGEYQIYRAFLPHRLGNEPVAVPPSHQRILTIKDGETVQIQYGGDGRSVTGQAVPENPAIAVDWLNDPQSLELVRPSTAGGPGILSARALGLEKQPPNF